VEDSEEQEENADLASQRREPLVGRRIQNPSTVEWCSGKSKVVAARPAVTPPRNKKMPIAVKPGGLLSLVVSSP
jgi:hypothetical protein